MFTLMFLIALLSSFIAIQTLLGGPLGLQKGSAVRELWAGKVHKIDKHAMGDLEYNPVALDSKGISTELNYHHIRAREIEMGIEVDELTSCTDESCRVCRSPHTERAVKELVGTGEPVTFDRLSDQLDEIQQKLNAEFRAKRQAEKAKRDAEIAERKRAEYEAQFTKDYDASSFRPVFIPVSAEVESMENVSGVFLIWRWDGKIYHKYIHGMTIHRELKADYIDGCTLPQYSDKWCLRKRRPIDKKDDRFSTRNEPQRY